MQRAFIKKLTVITAFLSLTTCFSIVAQAEEAPPSISFCTENSTLTSNTKLCKGGTWVTCDNSQNNQKSTDGLLVCNGNSGKWEEVSSDNPPPPEDDNDDDDPDDFEDFSKDINITDDDAEPSNFNPAIEHSRISFTLSDEALIEVRIENPDGETVVKLVEDKKLDDDEHFVNWYGTKDNYEDGEIVRDGTYTYKIIARNPVSETIEDTADGKITVSAFMIPDQVIGNPADQAKATVILQNEFKGQTSKTGTAMIVYFAFPLAYFFIRKSWQI